ncbi:MAG: winged helix-turn-helix domain-containing protein [Actinomycetota bacterium]|nr:winged helix-turn-helix domain-containing protein [Actinomycetota bacterium]
MEARAESGERISFVIERGAGRVLVADEPVELPPKEFRLLLELADAPGEARPAADLIEAVWGPNSQMSGNDVYWLVWKLRRRIGDGSREHKILTNRKGHGYLIDPGVAELAVVDVLPADPPPAVPGLDSTELPSSTGGTEGERTESALAGADLARESGTFDPVAPVAGAGNRSASSGEPAVDDDLDRGALPLRSPQDPRRSGLRRHLVAAALVVAAAAAGVAARSITSGPTDPPSDDTPRAAVETTPPERRDHQERTRPRARQLQPDRGTAKTQEPSSGGGGPAVAAAPPAATAPSRGSGAESTVEAQPRPHVKRAPKPQAPQLPPPPTRYLYHLYNSENGDHFVTTDGGAVTEHEAKGYEGGAIGRVYVSPEKATKAIALNKGSAFVFAGAAPKTEPASSTLPLWLAKSEGDFFYTTSESEASQDGWSATLIGYVRTL